MRLDSLVRLVEASDFMSFRELAIDCLRRRGYREIALTDGWKDGGTDLRVFDLPPNPAKIAFQITVERDWKSKLQGDAKKSRERLGLQIMTLVCSRRVPEHEFEQLRDSVWKSTGVQVSRIDSQSIATTYFQDGATGRVLEILGVSADSGAVSVVSSPRALAALSCSFFGQDAQSFRDQAIDSTIVSVLSAVENLKRSELVRQSAAILNLEQSQAPLIEASIDRLLQKKSLVSSAHSLRLSDALTEASVTLQKLRAVEEDQLKASIRKEVKKFSQVVSAAIVDAVVVDLGALMIESAKDAVASLGPGVSESGIADHVKRRLRHLHSTLDGLGVGEGADRDDLLERITAIGVKSPIAKHLYAGELFLSMLSMSTSQLIRAFGARRGIHVVLDASVAIPMLCTLLYRVVSNRFSLSARHAYDQLRLHGQSMLLPRDYLEEAATHLIYAWRDYSEIADIDSDLALSENSFVSHYVNLRSDGDGPAFSEFMDSFGLDVQLRKADFYAARDTLMNRLQLAFDRYGIQVAMLGKPSYASLKRAEEGIAYAVQKYGRSKPAILQKHDARTIAYLHDRDRSADEADVLCTWDGIHFWMHEKEAVDWLVMNPAILGDIFSVARPTDTETHICAPLVLAKALSEEAAESGARVLDTIVRLERGKEHDAKLLAEARRFKVDLLSRARPDLSAKSIESQWTTWKASYHLEVGKQEGK